MIKVGFVSSEGAPLLIGETSSIQGWQGIDGPDYAAACELFDRDPAANGKMIEVGARPSLVWDMGGAGTADVFRVEPNTLLIVRGWFDQHQGENALWELATAAANRSMKVGQITVASGAVAILSATENGSCVDPSVPPRDGRPAGAMSTEESGLVAIVWNGTYSCFHEDVKARTGTARRCRLSLQP